MMEKFTKQDIKTLIRALNGYIHLEKNCNEHVELKFFKMLEKLERIAEQ